MRLRLKYTKTGTAAYLGHLEVLRLWQRVIRRAGLPVAYSEGFNPHPKIAFGPALAVGVESLAEYLDVEFTAEPEPGETKERLQEQLPGGMSIELAYIIPDRAPALTAIITAASYRVLWLYPPETDLLQQRSEELLGRNKVEVVRSGKDGLKVKDIRPGIFQLSAGPGTGLRMLLETSPQGSVRPEQVVEAMGLEQPSSIVRTGLYLRHGNDFLTPEETNEFGR